MIKYIKVKIFSYKIKKALYEAIPFIDECIKAFVEISKSSQDSDGDKLRKEFIDALAGIIHDDNQNKKTKNMNVKLK